MPTPVVYPVVNPVLGDIRNESVQIFSRVRKEYLRVMVMEDNRKASGKTNLVSLL